MTPLNHFDLQSVQKRTVTYFSSLLSDALIAEKAKTMVMSHFHKLCTALLLFEFLTPSQPLWLHQSVCTVHSRGQLFTFQLTFLWRKRQKHWWCLIFIMTLKSPLMLFSTADCFHQVHHSINNKKYRQGGWMAPDWPSHICHPSLSDEVLWCVAFRSTE